MKTKSTATKQNTDITNIRVLVVIQSTEDKLEKSCAASNTTMIVADS